MNQSHAYKSFRLIYDVRTVHKFYCLVKIKKNICAGKEHANNRVLAVGAARLTWQPWPWLVCAKHLNSFYIILMRHK